MISNAKLLTRRTAVVLLVATGVVASSAQLRAEGRPAITVHKDPSCRCCSA
jgi:hypothetical protein